MVKGGGLTAGDEFPIQKGNSVKVLIDAGETMNEALRLIRSAKTRIDLTQLYISADFFTAGKGESRGVFLDSLLRAAKRGVAVKIILNGSALSRMAFSEYNKSFKEWFEKNKSPNLKVGLFDRDTFSVFHAKTLTVDGVTSIILGFPFSQE